MPPYEQPGPSIAFWTLFGLFALGEYVARIRGRLNKRGAPVERWSLVVVVVSVVGGMLAAFELANWRATAIGAGRWVLFVVGLVLMAGGIALRQWAIATLGRSFTVDVRVQPGQSVVERGPYRWVRHPSYTGFLVFVVGIGLALDNWGSLIVVAVLPAAGFLARIRSEERALLAGLGDDYRRYAAGRRRLVPGVW